MLLFVIIYDWSDFKKGLMGKTPGDTAQIEKIDQ